MRLWKILGLAGLVGVTALGVAAGTWAVQRHRREFREADTDELRHRLHARLAAANGEPVAASATSSAGVSPVRSRPAAPSTGT